MPMVELGPQVFSRLQAHAVPLVDTIESVISRILDAYEASGDRSQARGDGQSARAFNPDAPPDLTHAKILGVSFGVKKLGRGEDNWNGLLNTAVREAKTKSTSMDEFRRLLAVNHVIGDKQNEGFRPIPGTGISIQGQDANGAWRAARHIAQQLGYPLSVRFAWREKEGAAFPGQIGQMSIDGG